MKHATWLSAPFAQPTTQGSSVAVTQPSPAPVAMGCDDTVILFRSSLLRTQADGVALRAAFDRMAAAHPMIAAGIASLGSLGRVSYERAVTALITYARTGVATTPHPL